MSLISEAATKDGLPRASFAYTPTDEPTTWKLPYLTAAGAPDPSHLPGAAAAVSSGGFRGERVDVPSSALPVIKAKLRSAYRRWGKPSTEWPESIREDGALVEQALDWAYREDTGSDPAQDDEWLMDLAMNRPVREAWDESVVRRDGEGQFTFKSGGSKSGGTNRVAGPVVQRLARKYGVEPDTLNTDEGQKALSELRDALKARDDNDGKWTDEIRQRLISARSYLATGKRPSPKAVTRAIETGKAGPGVVLWREAGDDHFYGPWRGGAKGGGGRPGTPLDQAKAQVSHKTAAQLDAEHAALVKQMDADAAYRAKNGPAPKTGPTLTGNQEFSQRGINPSDVKTMPGSMLGDMMRSTDPARRKAAADEMLRRMGPLPKARTREADEEHFHGAWRGGKASSGGGPASEKGKGTAEQRRKEMAARVGAENVGNLDNLPPSKRPASKPESGSTRSARVRRENARFDAAADREHESWGRKASQDATNATKRRIGMDSPNYSSERFGDLHGRWEKVRDAAIAKGADGEAIDKLRTNFARGADIPAYRLNAPTVPTRYSPIQRGSREMALLRAKAEKGDRYAARELNRISDSRRAVREADVMEFIAEAGDDHFYGSWAGGSKAAGGRPEGGTPTVAKGGSVDKAAYDAIAKPGYRIDPMDANKASAAIGLDKQAGYLVATDKSLTTAPAAGSVGTALRGAKPGDRVTIRMKSYPFEAPTPLDQTLTGRFIGFEGGTRNVLVQHSYPGGNVSVGRHDMDRINWARTGGTPVAIRPPSAGAAARANLAAKHASRLARSGPSGPITTTPAQARANLSRRLGRA